MKALLYTEDNQPILILGLSGENVTRLMAHEPISMELATLGLPAMKLIIMGGRTEAAIVAELRDKGVLPPDTGSVP
jgi:hypothetical protein